MVFFFFSFFRFKSPFVVDLTCQTQASLTAKSTTTNLLDCCVKVRQPKKSKQKTSRNE
jgi:hypothetical protein